MASSWHVGSCTVRLDDFPAVIRYSWFCIYTRFALIDEICRQYHLSSSEALLTWYQLCRYLKSHVPGQGFPGNLTVWKQSLQQERYLINNLWKFPLVAPFLNLPLKWDASIYSFAMFMECLLWAQDYLMTGLVGMNVSGNSSLQGQVKIVSLWFPLSFLHKCQITLYQFNIPAS